MLGTVVSGAPSKNVWDDYPAWLANGKKLVSEHNNRNWRLGDWLLEGDEYNLQNLGIESHLLIGSHPPKFWKEVSAEVDLAVGTLKNLALVARRFPEDKRIPDLSWSHHQIAARFQVCQRRCTAYSYRHICNCNAEPLHEQDERCDGRQRLALSGHINSRGHHRNQIQLDSPV